MRTSWRCGLSACSEGLGQDLGCFEEGFEVVFALIGQIGCFFAVFGRFGDSGSMTWFLDFLVGFEVLGLRAGTVRAF